MKFAHLHVHTQYSLLDGLSKISDDKNTKRPGLVSVAREQGSPAIALTDHGAMYGAIEFYKECLAKEIKPLVGCEVYLAKKSRLEKSGPDDREKHHLILLSKNQIGYKNLMKLVSIGYLEGFYYKPRVDWEVLEKYHEGLIATSACYNSEIALALNNDNYDSAKTICERFLNLFGEDFYLELQRHQYDDFIKNGQDPMINEGLKKCADKEKKVEAGLIKLSRELGIPLVATNDVHYINQNDAIVQDALLCIQTGKNMSDIKRLRYVDSPTFYLRSPGEMSALFSDLPEAIENTVKVADKCNLEITLGKWFFPKFDLPEGQTPEDVFRAMARQGLFEKIPDADETAKQRLEYEMDIICQKGYAPYFLIVADYTKWIRENKINASARGSVGGSLVSYVMGIIPINPLYFKLPFERFLNPFRPSPPDVDLDIADNRREELIEYIKNRYGQEKFSQICTFGRIMSRSSIRDIGRVMGYPYSVPDHLAKLVPIGSQGFPMTLDRALKENSEFRKEYESNQDAKKIIDLAKQIENSARHVSLHAAGIVLAATELTDFSPLQLDPKGKKIITQYEMHACEDIGLVKFDILGIRHLSFLDRAVKIIEEETKEKLNLDEIDFNDKKTYETISRGETMGIFQLGGAGMTRYLKELKPTNIFDIMAMVALFRPGPMAIIPDYIRRKHNKDLIEYFDFRMKEFLKESLGLIVYQDDVLFTVINIAGYNWEEADKFRKAVGKKIPGEMAKQKEKFVDGCVKNGLSLEKAEELFKLIEPFSGYGFNKAHAALYAVLAYKTAYLKTHYPVEYMTSVLDIESTGQTGSNDEKVAAAIAECRRLKIPILPPDINQSEIGFTVEKTASQRGIRFGLSAIKNVGAAAIECLLAARKDGPFMDFSNFLQRVELQKVNKKVLESLTKAGALDSFGKRAALLMHISQAIEDAHRYLKQGNSGQDDLFASGVSTRKLTIKLPETEEFSRNEMLALERELLGFYLTEHPMEKILDIVRSRASHLIEELKDEISTTTVTLCGLVKSSRVMKTKKGQGEEMAFVTISDKTGSIEVVVFPRIYNNNKQDWLVDRIVVVAGRLDKREVEKENEMEERFSLIAESVVGISSADDLEKLEVMSPTKDYYPDEEPISQSKPSQTNSSHGLNLSNPTNSAKPTFFKIEIPRGTSSEILKQINTLLKENPGKNQVVLLVHNGGNSLKEVLVPYGVNFTAKLQSQIHNLINPQ